MDKNRNKVLCTHLLLTQVILSETCSSVDESVYVCVCLYLSLPALLLNSDDDIAPLDDQTTSEKYTQ